ncbi:MAG: peptidoglycan binding protein CsiV [Gammaproteobacteria bacterium]|nr:peptidoglycan binding protein CsiV [Gammaproteobacteria bacterium]
MNIHTRLIATFFLFFTGVLTTSLHAAPVLEESEEKLDWYDIEVIVFRHHDYKALSREKWARDPGSPMIRNARELLPPLPENLTAAHSEKLKGPISYLQLHQEHSRLQDKFDLLHQSSGYEPLIHLSWRQPGLGPEEAEAVHVHGGVNWSVAVEADTAEGAEVVAGKATVVSQSAELDTASASVSADELEGPPAPFIDGTIKLIRKRFLHIEADFLYRAPYIENKDNLLAHEQWPQAFRLQESRRMRSREIHYLDHPMFGVLILATPYEAPVEEVIEVEEGSTPLLSNGTKRLGGSIPPTESDPLSGTIRR